MQIISVVSGIIWMYQGITDNAGFMGVSSKTSYEKKDKRIIELCKKGMFK